MNVKEGKHIPLWKQPYPTPFPSASQLRSPALPLSARPAAARGITWARNRSHRGRSRGSRTRTPTRRLRARARERDTRAPRPLRMRAPRAPRAAVEAAAEAAAQVGPPAGPPLARGFHATWDRAAAAPPRSACAGCGHPSPWQRPLGAPVSARAPAQAPLCACPRPGARGRGRCEGLLWPRPNLFRVFGNRSLSSFLQRALRAKRSGRPRSERILRLFF